MMMMMICRNGAKFMYSLLSRPLNWYASSTFCCE